MSVQEQLNYYEPEQRSTVLDWIVGACLPFVALWICLSIRKIPDSVTYYIRVGSS